MLSQENIKLSARRTFLAAGFVLILSALPAFSAENRPDPILSGPVPGPCAEQAAGAAYVDGVDAAGNPVTPAGGPGATAQMGDGTVMFNVRRPHGRDVQVPVYLADLAPASCAAHRSPR